MTIDSSDVNALDVHTYMKYLLSTYVHGIPYCNIICNKIYN